jgi:hypothetical protein
MKCRRPGLVLHQDRIFGHTMIELYITIIQQVSLVVAMFS